MKTYRPPSINVPIGTTREAMKLFIILAGLQMLDHAMSNVRYKGDSGRRQYRENKKRGPKEGTFYGG